MNNPLILGIETSGRLCSIAWWQDETILLEYNLESKNEHTILLDTFVKKGLEELKIDPKSITLVVIASGPGSFTGLRIGMSYAKGFCSGYSIPLIPVTNFELLADLIKNNNFPVYTVIEAGRGNYYTAIFKQKNSNFDNVYLSHVSHLKQQIPEDGQIVVHEEIAKGYFKQFFDRNSMVLNDEYHAARLCVLGYYKQQHEKILNLDQIEPLYLQSFPRDA
jgi:tRNA threonylcarbamoyladenosine biosynthesis protein TsaB